MRDLSKTTVVMGYNYGGLHEQFVHGALVTYLSDKRLQGKIAINTSLYIETGRNEVARRFLDTKAEWLWFVDTDVGFEPDVLGRLLDATHGAERKIVAAGYWTPGPRGEPLMSWLDKKYRPHSSLPRRDPIALGACGLGCTLIHRQVLEDIAKLEHDPRDPWVWFGRDLLETESGWNRAGEDVTMCIRARKAGHETWGVPSLVVDHHKMQLVKPPEDELPQPEKPLTQEYRQTQSGLVLPV